MSKEDWYLPDARAHTEKIKKRILASRAALSGVNDSNVAQLGSELEAEKKNVRNWHRYGGQLQDSKEIALKRALTYAHDSIVIGKEIGNMKLVFDGIEVLAEIDSRYIIGGEEGEGFGEYAGWVDKEVAAAYKKGMTIKPSVSVICMRNISNLSERLKREYKARRQFEQFEASGGRSSVHAASIAGFLAGAVLLLEGITGYTVGGLSQAASNTVGLVLFILSLVGMVVLSKTGRN